MLRKVRIEKITSSELFKYALFKCKKCSTDLLIDIHVWAKGEEQEVIFADFDDVLNIKRAPRGEVQCRVCEQDIGNIIVIKDFACGRKNAVKLRLQHVFMCPESPLDVVDVSSTPLCFFWNG